MNKHDLQHACDHRPATQLAAQWEQDKTENEVRDVFVRHMHCPRCGMFFGREDWNARKGEQ